jgi:hypothetical protein
MLLYPKGSGKLLKPVPFGTISERGEAGQAAAQEGGSRAQRQIATFARDQPPDEDQLELGAGLRIARLVGTQGTRDTVLWDKK